MDLKLEEERLLTVPEFGGILRLKDSTVRSWLLHRKIESVRVGKRAIRIPLSEAKRLIAQGTIPARQERT